MQSQGWATRTGRSGPGTRRAAASIAALALLLGPLASGPAAVAAPDPAAPPPPAAIDARSAPIVDSLMSAMGGLDAWDRLPAIRFDFVVQQKGKEVVRRRHWWDKAHGRARVEWTDAKGRAVAAVVNLSDRSGRSCTAGVPDADSLRAEHVKDAYAMWVNDTYWLAMPFKLHDPGVRIAYDRTEKGRSGTYDVLSLTFGDVGLTPKDHYWLFLNRATHRIDRWEYLLQGAKPPALEAAWTDYRKVGPVTMPMVRDMGRRPMSIRFESVATPAAFDDRLLTDPCARE